MLSPIPLHPRRAGADYESRPGPGVEEGSAASPWAPSLLLSPPRLFLAQPDTAQRSPIVHHQFDWVRVPLEPQPRPEVQGRTAVGEVGGLGSGQVPAWVEAVLVPVRRLAGYPELGQRSGEEKRGRLGQAARPGAAGRGAGGGPSPGISGDHVTALAEGERSGTPGPAADWAPGPLLQQPAGLAAPPLPTLTPCGGPLCAPGQLCYGRAASTSSCRRVPAAPSHCRNYPAPGYCGVCAGPAPPGRDFPPPFGCG